MWLDWVSNPGLLALESDALPTMLYGPGASKSNLSYFFFSFFFFSF